MKAYFDRTQPFYLTTTPSFYATEVEVDEVAVKNIASFSRLLVDMKARVREAASAERADPELAEYFVSEVLSLFKTIRG